MSIGPETTTVAEGATQVITVTLSATFTTDKVIPLTIGGTATTGTDYSGVPTSVTVAANTTTATFTLSATTDLVADSGETVIITLGAAPSDVTNGTPNTATVTITDNGDPPVSQLTRPRPRPRPVPTVTVPNGDGDVRGADIHSARGRHHLGDGVPERRARPRSAHPADGDSGRRDDA